MKYFLVFCLMFTLISAFSQEEQKSSLNIEGQIISSEYISKMVNNYTVFKAIIRENFIRTEGAFYHFMTNNMKDVYHWQGKYFKRITLPVLINTSRRGNIGEQNSLRFFKQSLQEKKGILCIEQFLRKDSKVQPIDISKHVVGFKQLLVSEIMTDKEQTNAPTNTKHIQQT